MASAWLNYSPRHLSYAFNDPNPNPTPPPKLSDSGADRDGSDKDPLDFEFTLSNSAAMLTADELFADGKLVPLQLTSSRPRPEIKSTIALSDPPISSPRAPKCVSRWRELLGLRRVRNPKPDPSRNPNPNPGPDPDPRTPPSLRDSDCDSLSLSTSRLSLSSASSSSSSSESSNRVRIRPVTRPAESPRMSSSGKIVFFGGGLERSSSSPSSFDGGARVRARARGMQRSFSANVVRVSPVLNVPVCSGSVLGFFSSRKGKGKGRRRACGPHVIRYDL